MSVVHPRQFLPLDEKQKRRRKAREKRQAKRKAERDKERAHPGAVFAHFFRTQNEWYVDQGLALLGAVDAANDNRE